MLHAASTANEVVSKATAIFDRISTLPFENAHRQSEITTVAARLFFLVFPFTRLVHIWSGFGVIAYLVRPYQVVRTRRKWKATGVQG